MTCTPSITHCHIGHILCAGCFQALAQTIALRHEYNESAVGNLSQAYFLAELHSNLLTVTAAALQASAIQACRDFQAFPSHEDRISFDDDEPLISLRGEPNERGFYPDGSWELLNGDGWDTSNQKRFSAKDNFISRVLRVRDRVMGRMA